MGNGAVGKTSIAQRFANSVYSQSYKQTVGLDFFMKRLNLPNNVEVALQLWDIGGQSIGGKMINKYIYGANAVIFCYDVTNGNSFMVSERFSAVFLVSPVQHSRTFVSYFCPGVFLY